MCIDALDDEGRGRGTLAWGAPPGANNARPGTSVERGGGDEGGDGDSDGDGVDVAVRGAFVGDRVRMVVERGFPARRLVIGRALELMEPGPTRVPGRCGHAWPTVCCPLDGLDPALQAELKRERIARALCDVGLEDAIAVIEEVVLPRAPLGRRQKIKLVAGGRRGALCLGLYAPWSRQLVRADGCAYTRVELSEATAALRRALDEAGVVPASEHPAGLRAVILRAFREGPACVLVTGAPLPAAAFAQAARLVEEGALLSLAERVDASGSGSVVGGAVLRQHGPEAGSPLEGGPPAHADAFCQADPALARLLYRHGARYVAQAPPGPLLDLYAGTGGFSRALRVQTAAPILAVERAHPSVASLRALGIEALGMSVEDALHAGLLRPGGASPAGIVADPPRKGLGEAAAGVAALGATRFALVSCDPDAMAADAAALVAAGYAIERIVPYDLFSGTPEVEALTLLRHRGASARARAAPGPG